MGDRSPKSNNKLASQKQGKTDQKNRGKQAEADAKLAAKAKSGKTPKK